MKNSNEIHNDSSLSQIEALVSNESNVLIYSSVSLNNPLAQVQDRKNELMDYRDQTKNKRFESKKTHNIIKTNDLLIIHTRSPVKILVPTKVLDELDQINVNESIEDKPSIPVEISLEQVVSISNQ